MARTYSQCGKTMEIKTQSDGNKLTITVSGRVDTVTAPKLEAGLKFGEATCVVLDLGDVPYMSSAGLRLLLVAHKTMLSKGGDFQVANIQPAVKEVLDITGFSGILHLV